MRKKIFIFILPLLTLISCGVGDAEKVADQYHDLMKSESYETIVNDYISEDGLEITPKREWLNIFKAIKSYGKIVSIEKISGFNTHMNNGITTVTLRYEYQFKSSKILYERLILTRSSGDNFMIAGIGFNENLDKLPMPKNN
ncbi:MAG: hypothetical protein ACWA41_07970 [Putridiphycobacter sp.]